jgi:hypothetical protein
LHRTWVTLVGALVALAAGLVAFVLLKLRTAPVAPRPGELLYGPVGHYLLLLFCFLAAVALLVLIATAATALAYDTAMTDGRSASRPPDLGTPTAAVSRVPTTSRIAEPTDIPDEPPDTPENGPWMKLVEECVEVVDELDEHKDGFDAPRRELAEHLILRLEEVLERSGVEVITDEPVFDRARHKPIANGGAAHPGAVISETVSPGFAVGRRVLRRAQVRLE